MMESINEVWKILFSYILLEPLIEKILNKLSQEDNAITIKCSMTHTQFSSLSASKSTFGNMHYPTHLLTFPGWALFLSFVPFIINHASGFTSVRVMVKKPRGYCLHNVKYCAYHVTVRWDFSMHYGSLYTYVHKHI